MTPEKDRITETIYLLVVTPEIDKRHKQWTYYSDSGKR